MLSAAENRKMNELDDEFYKYEDKLEQLMEAYVSKNAEVFGLK
jgi:hypothetical protein